MDAIKTSMSGNPVAAAVVIGLIAVAIASAAIHVGKPKWAMALDSTTSAPKYNKKAVSAVLFLVGILFGAASFYGIKAMTPMSMGFRFAMESCGCGY